MGKHKIRTRSVIIGMSYILGIAVVAMQVIFLLFQYSLTTQAAHDAVRNSVRILDQIAQRVLTTAETAATRAAHLAREGEVPEVIELRSLGVTPPVSGILLIDAEGRPVARIGDFPEAYDQTGGQGFSAIRDGRPIYVEGTGPPDPQGKAPMSLHKRIADPDGGLLGAVRVDLSSDLLGQMPRLEGPIYNDIELAVWFDDGAASIAERAELTRLDDVTPAELTYQTIDGRHWTVSLRQVGDWPVKVAAGVPNDSVLAPFRRQILWSLVFIAAAWSAIGTFGFVGSRLTAREEAARLELAEARDGLNLRVAERTAELETAATRLRSIFDAMQDATALLDLEGRVIDANPGCLSRVGEEGQAILGEPLWNSTAWLGEHSRGTFRDAVSRALAGESVRFQSTARARDGETISLDVSVTPVLGADGGVESLLAEARDVTEFKNAQERLREAHKFEILGKLTGTVAHDFNNLLMAILGNLDFLRKRLPSDPETDRLLDGATSGAEKGATLTRRLLSFSRRNKGSQEPVDVGGLVGQMDNLLERSIKPSIKLKVTADDNLPAVLVDAHQLELAILNLCVNARDAIAGSGTIAVSVGLRPIFSRTNPAGLPVGKYVCISVRDDGAGMDADTLRHATEPFYTTKAEGHGSGLGLAMVHGLAAQAGGALLLHSRPGEGTTAEIWLPALRGKSARPRGNRPSTDGHAPLGPASVLPALRVLAVEDDAIVAMNLHDMLQEMGHHVIGATSAEEALNRLESGEAVDLVITDYALPGITGGELCEILGKDHPDLPVIIASGYDDIPSHGAAHRLLKPYRQGDLERALAAAFSEAACT